MFDLRIYAEDGSGFFNLHFYLVTGRKARPLAQESTGNVLQFDNSFAALKRKQARERQQENTPAYKRTVTVSELRPHRITKPAHSTKWPHRVK